MKRKLLFFIIIFLLIAPFITATAVTTLEQPLPGMPPTVSGPADYIIGLFISAISIVGLVAVTTIAFGGFVYLTSAGNKARIDYAKDVIGWAIGGLLLLLLAYLIFNTVNPDIVNLKDPTLINIPTSGVGPPTNWVPTGNTLADDAQVRTDLLTMGIPINKSACSIAGQINCTYLGGIRQTTIDGAKNLKANCGCSLIITAGTESGGVHSSGSYSHENGYKVDYALNNELNNYIENNYTYSGIRSDNAKLYKDPKGNVYARESDHWDVTYYSA